ncbi:hypothetical protein [Streptomyces sp. I05A-00742]|uniref:hypothetical protein n=1 Tax=Streptomyces sp. I05A-00742 TaxID=2732853 RepID=UPI0014892B9B|nr:hypothetical protein [Streptomyces sp. I05A-00742]
METTSRAVTAGTSAGEAVSGDRGGPAETPGDRRPLDGYLQASFPWYGLDEAFTGRRWLMQVGTAADGTVEHGSTGHGAEPTLGRPGQPAKPDRFDKAGTLSAGHRFSVVVTVASRPVRRSADGTGVLEATSVSSAAWLAGAGLLSYTWPVRMERALRQNWLDQQTALAWELADHLDEAPWTTLSLPVDGVSADFRYRESEYGWVLAGSAPHACGDSGSCGAGGCPGGVHIGAYGRGMSAYGMGFSAIGDIAAYAA